MKKIISFFTGFYSNLSDDGKGWSWSMIAHILVFASFLILPYTILNSVYRSLASKDEEKIIYVDLSKVKIDVKTHLPEKNAKLSVKEEVSVPEKPKAQPKKEEKVEEKKTFFEKVVEMKNDALLDTKEEPVKEKPTDNGSKIVKEIKKTNGETENTAHYEQVNKDNSDLPETDDPNFIQREQIGGDERFNSGEELTISLIDAIRTKLRGCWNVDPSALGANDMKITIMVEFLPDGTVQRVEILDAEKFENDMAFRAVAMSARRAVFICSPFDFLPTELYEKWKTAEFNFYPTRGDIE